jgi:hypothetical protein
MTTSTTSTNSGSQWINDHSVTVTITDLSDTDSVQVYPYTFTQPVTVSGSTTINNGPFTIGSSTICQFCHKKADSNNPLAQFVGSHLRCIALFYVRQQQHSLEEEELKLLSRIQELEEKIKDKLTIVL